jgi:hypothetical protein
MSVGKQKLLSINSYKMETMLEERKGEIKLSELV